ncbi:VTT domain-containing protein [Spiribacter vilamensis]|uniref:Undecaprenyl-diphosphatase n=1 Tax=Spiribacter vilamensis TaxID=531306 RepID=A0A4Q8D2P6_9GAMM|nr:VTT domain-containing protein [Spiribacter vilamensis]RZU99691.1 undecaprenyl-diphosphatase [Spiribacter vilamensis]TVO61359.1 phosphatase PAP2 family protein [Spiribacter vilamensis]
MSGLESALEPLFEWLSVNPGWTGLIIGLIALTESLALVGLIVPGAILMFLAGAAVGGSNIPILPMLLWAMAGAIIGDSLSYWLGRHYRDRLRTLPLIRRYPQALDRAERLFRQHGGKSVVLGRFIGPVRPVIPAVVGMLGMPPGRFFFANVSSALGWAPAYLLPGIVFGASVVLAMEVMGRLVAWLVLGFGGFLLLRWLIPRVDRPLRLAGNRLARAIGRHPPPGQWQRWLLPLHAAVRALRHRQGWLWWLALVAGLTTLSRAVIVSAPSGWERGLVALFNAQRTEALQTIGWTLTQAGGLLPVTAAVLTLFAVLRHRGEERRARYALLSVSLAVITGLALKGLIGLPRPSGLATTGDWGSAFPSVHSAAIAALVTAWITLLPWRALIARRVTLALGGVLVGAVSISRLLLGVHWPLDIVAGLGLGIVFGALPALVDGGARQPVRFPAAVSLSAGVLLAVTAAVTVLDWPDTRAHYPSRADLPAPSSERLGLAGPGAPFVAAATADGHGVVADDGAWNAPPPWRWNTLLRWISPRPDAARLPVLPRWHEGRLPDRVFIRWDVDPRQRWVLRIWRAETPAGETRSLIHLEREVIRPGVLLPRLRRHRPEPAAIESLGIGEARQ